MKFALKEWNTTIEALGKGRLIAIWRKGSESFNVEQKQFILYPTVIHQNTDKIKEEFMLLSHQNNGPNRDNQVKIKYWAEVEEEIIPETIDELLNISSELVNTNEHLVSSWNLHPHHKGKVLLLRVYSLTDPILITHSKEYNTSKSWIKLNIDIPKIGSKPVLSFKDFSQKVRYIKALLGQSVADTTFEQPVVNR